MTQTRCPCWQASARLKCFRARPWIHVSCRGTGVSLTLTSELPGPVESDERISLWGSINPLINTLWYIFSMGGPGGSHTARIRKEPTICSISLFTFSNDVVLFVYVIYVESVVWIMSDLLHVNKSKSELVTFSNRPASSIKTLHLFSEGKFQASGEVVHRHKRVSTWKR